MNVGDLVRVLIGDSFGEDFIPAGSCGLVIEEWDGTWYDETITEMDDDTASAVDTFLTEYCEDKEKSK